MHGTVNLASLYSIFSRMAIWRQFHSCRHACRVYLLSGNDSVQQVKLSPYMVQVIAKFHHGSRLGASRSYAKSWNLSNVNPFGSLVLRTGSNISYEISSVDPQESPSQDSASVSIKGVTDSDDLTVLCERRDDDILMRTQGTTAICGSLECVINIPVKFNIDAILGGEQNISISSLECDDISVKLESGICKLRSIQCHNLTVSADDGEVVCDKSLLSSIEIKTNSGDISVHKAMGPQLRITTQSGQISIKNLYSNESVLSSDIGKIHITNCHNKCTANIRHGDLKVDSVDGNLSGNIESGNINVHIDNHDTVTLVTKEGDISVSLPETLQTGVDLIAADVAVDDDKLDKSGLLPEERQGVMSITGTLSGGGEDGGGQPYRLVQPKLLTARARKGSIRVKCQDWFSSLNIPGFTGKI